MGAFRRVELTDPNRGGILGQGNVPEYYLLDGRRVFFTGARVFTLAKDGQLTPLPDGQYTLRDGSKMLINNGMRQANLPGQ